MVNFVLNYPNFGYHGNKHHCWVIITDALKFVVFYDLQFYAVKFVQILYTKNYKNRSIFAKLFKI